MPPAGEIIYTPTKNNQINPPKTNVFESIPGRTLPTAWYFLSPATESTQRTPPKPMVLDSLRGRDAEHIGILHLANKTEKPRPMLSHCPCVYPPRRAPRLCCSGITEIPPCVYRSVRCGHRALRNSIVKRCVGDDVSIVPPHLSTFHFPLRSASPQFFSPQSRFACLQDGFVL